MCCFCPGLADPLALPQAVSAYQACHFIGMPECDVRHFPFAYQELSTLSVATSVRVMSSDRMCFSFLCRDSYLASGTEGKCDHIIGVLHAARLYDTSKIIYKSTSI